MTTRARVAVLAGAAALVLGAAACGGNGGNGGNGGGAAAGGPERPLPVHLTPTEAGPQGRVPQFVVQCGFSHAAADDPIVHPGHAGASHLHDFFGATTTASGSTVDDLAAGSTTCDQPHDRAAYWAPALLDHGVPVVPTRAVAYYRPGVSVDPATVEPYPFGLKMLGGDPHAADAPVHGRRRLVVRHRLGAHAGPRDVRRRAPAAAGGQLPRLLGRRPPRQRGPPGPRRRAAGTGPARTPIRCPSRSCCWRSRTR